jgi:hypothetical protein
MMTRRKHEVQYEAKLADGSRRNPDTFKISSQKPLSNLGHLQPGLPSCIIKQ